MNNRKSIRHLQICILSLFIFLHICAAFSQQYEKITLFQCLEGAEESSFKKKEMQFLPEILDLKLRNLQAAWMPAAEFHAQASYQSDVIKIDPGLSIPGLVFPSPSRDQYKLAVDVHQLIYDGGIIRSRMNLEIADTRTSYLEAESELHKFKSTVVDLYFHVVIQKENIKILELFLGELEERTSTAKSRLIQGVAPEMMIWQLEIEKLRLSQKISEASQLVTDLICNLSELTGLTITSETLFEIPHHAPDFHSPVMRKEHEFFETLQTGLTAKEGLLKAGRMPNLSAFAQAGYGRPGFNMLNEDFDAFYLICLRLGWKITDWKNLVREKKIINLQSQIIDNQRKAFDQNLDISIQNEMSSMNRLSEALQKDSTIVELQEKVLLSAASRLDQGIMQPSEYIREFNAFMEVRIRKNIHNCQLIHSRVRYTMLKGLEVKYSKS